MEKALAATGVVLTCVGALLFWPEVHRHGGKIMATSKKEIAKTRIGGTLIILGSVFQIIAIFL